MEQTREECGQIRRLRRVGAQGEGPHWGEEELSVLSLRPCVGDTVCDEDSDSVI